MGPWRIHHAYMAAILLLSGAFLWVFGLGERSDYCYLLPIKEPNQVLDFFTDPTKASNNLLVKTTTLFISLGLMSLASLPWYFHMIYPHHRDFFIACKIRRPSENVTKILGKYQQKLEYLEFRALLVYVLLFFLVSIMLIVDVNKMKKLSFLDATQFLLNNGNPVLCTSDFLNFKWLKSVLLLILGVLIMIIITCFINICKYHQAFKDNIHGGPRHNNVVQTNIRYSSGPNFSGVEFQTNNFVQDQPPVHDP